MQPSLSLVHAQKIAQHFSLGDVCDSPVFLPGGRLHCNWKLTTRNGEFVVKRLSVDSFTQRDHQRICQREYYVRALANSLPVVCAFDIAGDPVVCIDGSTYLVFPFFDGTQLDERDVTINHVRMIALMLRSVHDACFQHDLTMNQIALLLHDFEKSFGKLDMQLHPQLPLIETICHQLSERYDFFNHDLVLSHCDLDPKNVLWLGDEFRVIDWEYLGVINRIKDVVVTGIYWSLTPTYEIRAQHFSSFLKTSTQRSLSAEEIDNGFFGLLDDWLRWLLLNLTKAQLGNSLAHQQALITLQALPVVWRQRSVLVTAYKS